MRHVTQQIYLDRANKLHNSKYDYSKTSFNRMTDILTVICPIHGPYRVQASNHVRQFRIPSKQHLKPCGCPRCGTELVRIRNKKGALTKEEFVAKANNTHNFKYHYPDEYVGMNYKIRIACPIHGDFHQQGINHVRGTGCPKCKNSKGQTKIAKSLTKRGIIYESEHTFEDCVGQGGRCLRFDFFIPTLSMIIEYDGEQHFKPVKFHAKMKQTTANEMLQKTEAHDQIKNEYAKLRNIKMVRITYQDDIETRLDECLMLK